jgi:pimeloyl-ACP methyl ester carboxylesterase
MSEKPRSPIHDLRGAARLAVEATTNVTEVVEAMHTTIAGGPAILGAPLTAPARAWNGLVYGSIRGVARLVGKSIDVALAQLEPLLGESAPSLERTAVVAALNGVLGDHLAATGNPLATEMRLCRDGRPLALDAESLRAAVPEAGSKVLVMLHGLCMNDRLWERKGHEHGAALAKDLGFTPVYLDYNTGLHISENGRTLDALLEALVCAWPAPIDELVLLGHSMGGLVARSACHYGEARAEGSWRSKVTRLVTLGTPHHGAPLERGGNVVEVLVGVSRYSAPLARLGKLRSAGITDLRHGAFLDAHWAGRDRFVPAGDTRTGAALPEGVVCYAVAGSLSPEGTAAPSFDGMVPVASALGRHANPRLDLAYPDDRTRLVFGTGHLDLLGSAEVYRTVRAWLEAPVT